MVGLYEDPFAYDGSDFNTFLGQDQFGSGSSPEDFHVTHTPTEPHFPAAIHPLKGIPHQQPQHPHHHHTQPPPYHLSPTDPDFSNALQQHHHLPRSAPTSFPSGPGTQQPNLSLDTMGLTWPTAATTNPPPPTPSQAQPHQNPSDLTATSDADLRALLTTLQSELRQAALDRDEARMQLSTARNELYAARQVEKRLRVERDEARSQADFLGKERAKVKATEGRLRRERNEARLALMMKEAGAAAAAAGGVGEESESPQGMDQG
ncbi:hypothetical protein NEMBOFW57_010625 [Staphylotrichum longicolle]|uniref:Uncharacterized protein n=1 Tax=Staphylotrichum longicolle TaxID=669026 RepID=A0AAD4EN48_9PEZI|nr:hypothetical protein NEMBOFW57_010625 [Staphylotrichum longicolle]